MSDTKSFHPLEKMGDMFQQAVMPIGTMKNGCFVPLGTGSMIATEGLMLTAGHVIDEAYSYHEKRRNDQGVWYDHWELYALYITDKKNQDSDDYFGGLWPIDEVWRPERLDLAVCYLRPSASNGVRIKFNVFTLCFSIPKLEEKVVGFGYYKMAATTNQNSEPIGTNYAHKTAFSHGKITNVHPTYRDSTMLHFPCFQTDSRYDPGMSGGPVFNSKGLMIGVICSSFGKAEEEHISYASLLWPLLGVLIKAARTEGGEVEDIRIHDLAKQQIILTDESINDVSIFVNPDGETIVHIK